MNKKRLITRSHQPLDPDIRSEAEKIYRDKKTTDLAFLSKEYGDDHLDFLIRRAEELRSVSDTFILIGVGGSNGAARALIEGLKLKGIDVIYAGNGLSPRQILNLLDIIDKREVSINIIAKNFKTLEPGLHFRVLREALIKKYGREEAKKRIVVTGTRDSLLEDLAKSEGYTFFEFDEEIGGRFSAFTNVCLFPLAVAGGDIKKYLQGKKDLLNDENLKDMVLDYVTYRHQGFRNGKYLEILSSFDLDFTYFNKWWVQLFGESEGVEGTGIYPDSMIFSEDLHSMGQFIQSGNQIFMETFIYSKNYDDINVPESSVLDDFDYLKGKTLGEINMSMVDATIFAHSNNNIRTFSIEVEDFSIETFSQLFTFFLEAVIVSSYLHGVSPYGQGGVEAYKNKMFELLKGDKND